MQPRCWAQRPLAAGPPRHTSKGPKLLYSNSKTATFQVIASIITGCNLQHDVGQSKLYAPFSSAPHAPSVVLLPPLACLLAMTMV